MSELADLTAEATGETVGEAKWAALRELERRHPGLDKAAVQFEVVSEGERGLLGVGYEPARVVAHLPAEAAEAVAAGEPATEESGQAGEARASSRRSSRRSASTRMSSRATSRRRSSSRAPGRTSACSSVATARRSTRCSTSSTSSRYRAYGEEKKDVVVDAAGYRERRSATLETLADEIADQVRDSGEREELEPMTAVERKVVHLRLKDVAGVGTTSEGTEPNRYVVVLPE